MIGLEERGLGFFKEKWDFKIDDHILFTNREFENDKQVVNIRKEITSEFLQAKKIEFLRASYYDPFEIVRSFNQYVFNKKLDIKSSKLFWDISNFNRQNLLILMWLLRKKYSVKSLDVFYTVPERYNSEISKGAKGFSSIPFFGGPFSKGKEKLLILLMGYEIDRPLYLFKVMEPSKVILGQGEKPTDTSFLNANKKAVEELNDLIYGAEIKKVPADDPHKAAHVLRSIFNENERDYNIMTSPLNTKLQTVGLYLACEANPDVQVVYSFPDKFSGWLSKGIKEVKRFKL